MEVNVSPAIILILHEYNYHDAMRKFIKKVNCSCVGNKLKIFKKCFSC